MLGGLLSACHLNVGGRVVCGDIYYEYLLKVWLQQGGVAYNENNVAYL
jgi:hypothetical protein